MKKSQKNYKQKNKKTFQEKLNFKLITVVLLAFVIGIGAAQSNVIYASISEKAKNAYTYLTRQSDEAWAKSKGYGDEFGKASKLITQAEFLKMVMKELGDTEYNPKYKVAAAENHWAKNFYSAGRANRVIACSCQIKPDEPLKLSEASEFIMLAVNEKSKTRSNPIGILDVEEWVNRQDHDRERNITYTEAITLVRGMVEKIESIQEGEKSLEENKTIVR